jgi:L-lysine exporter family protein LysE/ArgO
MSSLLFPILKGCLTGGSLIVAIGAQNAFVLKQGLMRNQVFATALFCVVVDGCLIALGVGGLGEIFTMNQVFLTLAKWAGALFLTWYGYRSFRSVFQPKTLTVDLDLERPSLKKSLAILAAVSFLNPHVYLDTVVLLGSIGSQFEREQRPLFATGAILASCIWFFGLCFGARFLAPFFQKQTSWKVLDGAIGCLMWALAASLLLNG